MTCRGPRLLEETVYRAFEFHYPCIFFVHLLHGGLSLHAVVVLRIYLNLVAYEEQGGSGGYRQQRSYYNNAFHCI